MEAINGRIHSIQTLGTLAGPGVRFVVFFQGCHLRCGCCHNPDTWNLTEGKIATPEKIVRKATNYREYFGQDGGITLSGGEPLLQPEFAREIFRRCHEVGIHTCLDTSGSILSPAVKALLGETDRVLLDIKYTDGALYREHVGCSLEAPMEFLAYLQEENISTTLRQVIIPTLNDTTENILALREIVKAHSCVDKVELLPFRKICQLKYDKLRISFPFGHLPEPSRESMAELERLLQSES